MFRADHIGSLLRPDALLEARQKADKATSRSRRTSVW